jgi:hypothetical protein
MVSLDVIERYRTRLHSFDGHLACYRARPMHLVPDQQAGLDLLRSENVPLNWELTKPTGGAAAAQGGRPTKTWTNS